jgi:hypothetical protein
MYYRRRRLGHVGDSSHDPLNAVRRELVDGMERLVTAFDNGDDRVGVGRLAALGEEEVDGCLKLDERVDAVSPGHALWPALLH